MTKHMEFTKGKINLDEKWFVWNAFGKESFDSENKLTDEEWKEFITQCNEDSISLELEDWHMNYFDEYCYRIGKRDEPAHDPTDLSKIFPWIQDKNKVENKK